MTQCGVKLFDFTMVQWADAEKPADLDGRICGKCKRHWTLYVAPRDTV